MIDQQLKFKIIDQFRLDYLGVHGIGHWSRVRTNGLQLAAQNGADQEVIEYFAFLHDALREHENADSDHGARAANWIDSLELPLSEQQTELLIG